MDTRGIEVPTSEQIDAIAQALGQAPAVAYSTAHVYPWAAPDFARTPRAPRERLALRSLRLYAHVPFCNYACTYCSYAIKVGAGRAVMERYIAALERELEWVEANTPLSQLFIGGGTPTALPPDLLDRMLRMIFARAPSLGTEVHTVEASPETVTAEHLAVLRDHGVGRVSMGIQSLDDSVLAGVHRRHSADQALSACDLLARSGLLFNIDLIYGLPKQSEASLFRDVRAVVDRGVHAVTMYDLRLNERTAVARSLAASERLDLERLVRWRIAVRRAAAELGLMQTRWHTFRRPEGPAVRHRRAPHFEADGRGYQLGIGMSARSHLGYSVYRNHTRLEVYAGRVERGESPVEEVFPLEEADRKTQFVARSLGDGRPLERSAYEAAFGMPVERDFGEFVARLRAAGLVEDDGTALRLSDLGGLVHDRIMLGFYPPKAQRWLLQRALPGAARPA